MLYKTKSASARFTHMLIDKSLLFDSTISNHSLDIESVKIETFKNDAV